MLDIQKELEKFNRLLQDVDEDAASLPDEPSTEEDDDVVSEASGQAEPFEAAEDYTPVSFENEVFSDEATNEDRPNEYAVPTQDETDLYLEGHATEPGAQSLNDLTYEIDDEGDASHEVAPFSDVPIEANAGDSLWGDHYSENGGAESDTQDVELERPGTAWDVTELVTPGVDVDPLEDTYPANPQQDAHTLAEESHESAGGWPQVPATSVGGLRYPNLGVLRGSEQVAGDVESVDSLLLGARSALTDSHHLRPRVAQGVTVTLPEPEEVEEDDFESLSARILPLLTFKSGLFEERLGAVVGAVAGLVLLIAGALFVPSLFSSDEPEALADATLVNTDDHLHSAADPLVDAAPASLSIATFPPGARVYLNAELIGVTPFRGVSVEPGDYQVSVEKANFAAIDTFVTLNGGRDFFFDLSEEEGLVAQESSASETHQLLQVSEPVDAPRRRAEEPQLEEGNEAGRSVERSTADVSNTTTRSSNRSTRSRREAAPSFGALVVTSEPMGAVVRIDNEVVGETPATLPEIEAGSVTLKLEKDGFVPYETELNVVPSIQTPFHASLAPVKASLFVNASPGGDLYVDDVLVSRGIRPGHMELVPVGTRSIRIVNDSYGEYSQQVNVTTDNKASVSVDMVSHGYSWSIENGDRLFSESRYQEAIDNYQRALSIRAGNANLENKIALAAKAMAESSNPTSDSRNTPVDGIYSVTDTPPQLIGGLEALHANVIYPEEAYNEGIQGRVYVQFVVDENGRAQDIKIAKGLQGGCNEAAIRAVKKSKFRPATVGGVPVKARHTLFVNFTI